jgi:hypothetical protein
VFEIWVVLMWMAFKCAAALGANFLERTLIGDGEEGSTGRLVSDLSLPLLAARSEVKREPRRGPP